MAILRAILPQCSRPRDHLPGLPICRSLYTTCAKQLLGPRRLLRATTAWVGHSWGKGRVRSWPPPRALVRTIRLIGALANCARTTFARPGMTHEVPAPFTGDERPLDDFHAARGRVVAPWAPIVSPHGRGAQPGWNPHRPAVIAKCRARPAVGPQPQPHAGGLPLPRLPARRAARQCLCWRRGR